MHDGEQHYSYLSLVAVALVAALLGGRVASRVWLGVVVLAVVLRLAVVVGAPVRGAAVVGASVADLTVAEASVAGATVVAAAVAVAVAWVPVFGGMVVGAPVPSAALVLAIGVGVQETSVRDRNSTHPIPRTSTVLRGMPWRHADRVLTVCRPCADAVLLGMPWLDVMVWRSGSFRGLWLADLVVTVTDCS